MGCEPSKEEIKDGARELVRYELQMLNAAVNMWLDGSRPRKRRLGSALLDSVLLHARSLYYFFASDKKRNDDIIASDLVPKKDNNLWASTKLGNFKKLHQQNINKFRSHLTDKRITQSDTKWTQEIIREIRDDINAAFDEFVACLPKSERSLWEIPDLKEKGKGCFRDYFQKS